LKWPKISLSELSLRSAAGNRERIYADCARSFPTSTLASLDRLRGTGILVTGASGFMGSWLLSALAFLNDIHGFGTRVTAVARHPARAEQRAPFLVGRSDIRWQAADVRQLVTLPDDLVWLVHAAGVPDSRHHATSPIETAAVIAEGTLRVLRLAEQATGLQRILHVSSGLVDGAGGHGRPAGPTMAYVEAKRFGETLCYAFRSQAKLPIVITRPFTFIGPFQDIDSPWAANNFLHAAIERQPLKIRGDGTATRAYLYGSDMAAMALAQMVLGESGDIFDLGGTEAMTVADLAHLVAGQVHRTLDIRINAAARSSGSDRFVPDMDRTVRQFGVAPAFSTADAVARSLDWYNR
jgi:nucleoside-diphosphate-sugar epimerase